jgi:hypothetical protein
MCIHSACMHVLGTVVHALRLFARLRFACIARIIVRVALSLSAMRLRSHLLVVKRVQEAMR